MRQIVLDTETTGLSAEGGDRIIEIGCVELVARKLTGHNKHWYLNPERDSHEDALKVHGISNEFLRDKPKFAAIADELLEYVEGAEIIIHNAAFGGKTRGFSVENDLAHGMRLCFSHRSILEAICST